MERRSPLVHVQALEASGRRAQRDSGDDMRLALRSRMARGALGLFFLAGIGWFVALVDRSAGAALDRAPAHTIASIGTALVLTPLLVACIVPLLDACLALLFASDSAGRWTRIMVEAAAGLVFALCAAAMTAALWPGVAVLCLAAAVGFVVGLRHWRPVAQTAREPRGVPLLVLLDELPWSSGGAAPLAVPLPSEGEAA